MRFEHDPDATLDYRVDLAARGWLVPGDTVASHTLDVTAGDGALLINSSAHDDTSLLVWVTGGTVGVEYELTFHVTTTQGRIDDVVATILVRESTAEDEALPGLEWPVDYGQCGTCGDLASMPASGIARFESMASEFLWRWTDRQFGLREGTIRPCRQDCTEGLSTYYGAGGGLHGSSPFSPTLIRGEWFNIGCGSGCGDACGCSWGRALRFEIPVYDIVSVEIDGATLPATAYRVDEGRFLVRQDGGVWPYCQNMNAVLGSEDTWAVTLRTGSPVPVGGQVAAGKLACELAKAACGTKGCELPSRVQSVTRQGVSISMMLDTFDDLDKGRTGIWLIDSWIASVTKPDIGFSIASPDYQPVGRRTTWRL
jgi:hypothetical protein